MRDENKTKRQLIYELIEMRQRVAELESVDTKYRRDAKVLRESGENLKAIVESIHDVIFQLSPTGFIQ